MTLLMACVRIKRCLRSHKGSKALQGTPVCVPPAPRLRSLTQCHFQVRGVISCETVAAGLAHSGHGLASELPALAGERRCRLEPYLVSCAGAHLFGCSREYDGHSWPETWLTWSAVVRELCVSVDPGRQEIAQNGRLTTMFAHTTDGIMNVGSGVFQQDSRTGRMPPQTEWSCPACTHNSTCSTPLQREGMRRVHS